MMVERAARLAQHAQAGVFLLRAAVAGDAEPDQGEQDER